MPENRRPALPAGYELVRDLAWSQGVRVVRARRAGRELVCRIDTQRGAAASRAELLVLGAVRHPDLLAVRDHGVTREGCVFVARDWVEGRDLAAWAEGRSPEEIGRAVARLCPALDALHAVGIAHGDLKPENALVGDDGRVLLCDFALARGPGAGAEGGIAGTPLYIAPEVLGGAAATPAADLFSLGVLLHRLLLPVPVAPREFYGRFPAETFFAATGTAVDDLPEWARDVVAALLERDPARRPPSAAAVGRTLAGRLGAAAESSGEPAIPSLSARDGREEWLAARAQELARGALLWIHTPPGEDGDAVAEALRLGALLDGCASRALDFDAFLASAPDAARLDAAAAALADEPFEGFLTVVARALDPWRERALDCLGRALARRGRAAAAISAEAPRAGGPFEARDLPALDGEQLQRLLAARVAAEPARIAELARSLADASGGAASLADARLADLAAAGAFLVGGELPRLRPGPLPQPATRRAAAPRDRARAELLAALEACGGAAPLPELAEAAGLAEDALDARLAEAAADGDVELARRAGEVVARARAGAGAADGVDWPALFTRRADSLERRGAVAEAALLAWLGRGDDGAAAELARELARLRDEGAAELALDLASRLARLAPRAGRVAPPAIAAEEALTWASLGQAERALALAQPLAGDPRPAVRALAERVHGAVAVLRHQSDAALAHFARAEELDPELAGEAAAARVFLLHTLGRDRDVERVAAEVLDGNARLTPRQGVYLRSLRAMSAFREGRVAEARGELDRLCAAARELGDAGREAALRIDLGILERRSGSLERAAEHLRAAAELYERSGNAAGLAHARATLGGTLRELGELVRAGDELDAALGIRERLGDEGGAAAVRGMLGLLLADRGWARAALSELTRGASGLSSAQRRLFAPLLEAKAAEVAARMGERRAAPDAGGARDPRVLLARAREAVLRGEADLGLARAEEARALAKSLARPAAEAEAELLCQAVGGLPVAARADAPPAVREDALLLRLLAAEGDAFDAARAEALARELELAGRDDRAARAWLAVAARAADDELARSARAAAARLLDTCTRGLTPTESAALRRHLLGLPDPSPRDLVTPGPLDDNAPEMEVLSLLEINHRLVAQEDLADLLGEIVEAALSVTLAERGFLVLEEAGVLRFDTALDSCRGDIDAPELEVSKSVVHEALQRMEPVRVSNAQDDPQLAAAPSVVSLDLRSILCVPFAVEDGLRGAIYVDHRVQSGVFTERSTRLLSLLSDQAALAIRQVRRMEEIRRLNHALRGEVATKESDLRTAQRALREAGLPQPAAGLVGSSQAIRAVHRLIERAAQSDLPVLVAGQSGTGKELVARGLHELSPRSAGPFVTENCAALPASLIEAELFGYRKGAFTGAESDRPGMFERASGGTLFLDEIGEMPFELQAKLLRVLETGEVRRLGANEPEQVDVRLVAATNRDLQREVEEGRFRADLYFRLDGLRVELPPLSERTEDVPELVEHFLRLEEARSGTERRISRPVLAKLCRRAWPGNVRELKNEVARLCVVSDGDITDPELVREPGRVPRGDAGDVRSLAELERDAILAALAKTGGDKGEAARLLGVSRSKIYQRLKEWDAGERS